jgi:glycosyltransferase involved in cell wall biosynthesis
MVDNLPLVSVCITTYNRKNLLVQTIKSILVQDYSNFEIIIVDDFSQDGTIELIKNSILKLDDRITYINHKFNKGLAAARNTAINNANGKYFTFCDDDDKWSKKFLSTFVYIANKNNNNVSFCSSLISRDQNIKYLSSSFMDFIHLGYTPPVASQFYNLEIIKNIGGYDETIKSGVDHDLWLNLAQNKYNLIWLNLNLVNINKSFDKSRMTLNFNNRLNEIKNSILIWKKKSSVAFGENFFIYFEKNYKYNTYKKMIFRAFDEKNFKFFVLITKLPLMFFFLDFVRFIKFRLKLEGELIHPTFFRYRDKNSNRNNIYTHR